MSYNTKGFIEMLKEFEQLDKRIQNTTASSAINKSAEVMLAGLKEEAPKAKANSTNSASYLDKETFKKGGSHQARMGINKNNWNKTKGLWYQYWGFSHLKRRRAAIRRPSKANQNHTYHEPNNWLDRAFDKHEAQCFEIITNEIEGALNQK